MPDWNIFSDEMSPYDLGWEAYEHGHGLEACEFDKMIDRIDWMEGWISAAEDDRNLP